MKKLRVALAGNPNAGKSTIFNALTGSRQHVGNWPGKTVEKKEGKFKSSEYEIEVIDLPGTIKNSPDKFVKWEAKKIMKLKTILLETPLILSVERIPGDGGTVFCARQSRPAAGNAFIAVL